LKLLNPLGLKGDKMKKFFGIPTFGKMSLSQKLSMFLSGLIIGILITFFILIIIDPEIIRNLLGYPSGK
jgi:hypothetical protein